jgi:hypothetical protein
VSRPLAAASDPEPVLRGSPGRHTDFMEQLQLGYIRAVAAAAGCVLSQPDIDEGIDLFATHRSPSHTFPADNVARLEIQLKATSDFVGKSSNHVSVDMRRDRWDYFRTHENTIPKIVVIMNLPKLQEDWTLADHDSFAIFHCSYWVNLADEPESTAQRPIAKAPKSQIFDDVALCGIMQRIGQGGRP